ncbi:MAG: spore coat protein CotJB [Eubacteriales bacterium]|nr:spore coat protein CotJB [Eubacteriales bacterium]
MSQMERKNLLFYIDAVSFAALDISLYLDSHPEDEEALHYFRHYSQAKQQALHEYALRFGPLTLDSVSANCGDFWKWAKQPWPWEMEDC